MLKINKTCVALPSKLVRPYIRLASLAEIPNDLSTLYGLIYLESINEEPFQQAKDLNYNIKEKQAMLKYRLDELCSRHFLEWTSSTPKPDLTTSPLDIIEIPSEPFDILSKTRGIDGVGPSENLLLMFIHLWSLTNGGEDEIRFNLTDFQRALGLTPTIIKACMGEISSWPYLQFSYKINRGRIKNEGKFVGTDSVRSNPKPYTTNDDIVLKSFKS